MVGVFGFAHFNFGRKIFVEILKSIIMFLHFRRRKPEVQDISYNPESAMLKAYTTAKRAEVGILYLGMRLRNYYSVSGRSG